MTLVICELKASALAQKLTPSKNTIVEAIRPHLYRHRWPAGTLTLEIRDASDTVIATSSPVDPDDIGSQDFFHGYVRFDINAGLKKNTEYTFKLISTGYSFSESAYIGWVNGYDLGKYDPTYTQTNSLDAPLDLEIWGRTTK